MNTISIGNEAFTSHALIKGLRERRRRQLVEAKEHDARLAQKRQEYGRIGKTGRLKRQLSTVAVMNAVDSEGREVLGPGGEEYWNDQDRREFGIGNGIHNIHVMRNRLGKVSWRKVY